MHCRQMFFQEATQSLDRCRLYYAAAGVGINRRTVPVKSQLEAAIFHIGKGIGNVRMSVMQPDRHLCRAIVCNSRRRAKKKHLLPRDKNALSEQLGKQLRKPRTAGEDEGAC